ncbi:hypothetical protein MalM25_04920 [Planctomycetes bacterium MalM25]|nr:hypothetical protein MalM25_04920 [Planctomycetes bacterium MalM25]
MRSALLWLAVVITLVAVVIEAFALNAIAYHLWAGSFAEAERQSHHQSAALELALISVLVPCVLAWVWVATLLIRRNPSA